MVEPFTASTGIIIQIINNMKNYQSISEGFWNEIVIISLTKEQISARDFLKTNEKKEVSTKKSKELTAFYETKKPTLEKEDTYQLISVNINENFNGIINCRINNEHKQIRF